MTKAKPEHGPGGLLQSFPPELSTVVTSTTPGPFTVFTVHEPAVATPLMQIDVSVGLVTRLPSVALVGDRSAGLTATYMSQPTSGSEFWTKTPTLKVEPTGSGPIEGGVAGQLVAVAKVVIQTSPVNLAFTVTLMLVAVVVAPSGEPVTIRVNTPVGVDREVVIVRTLVPVGVTGLGAKLHVTPARREEQDKVTG